MPGKDAYDLKTGRLRPAAVAGETAEQRAARIAELKRQIREGTYRPNLEKVAERLLPDLFTDGP